MNTARMERRPGGAAANTGRKRMRGKKNVLADRKGDVVESLHMYESVKPTWGGFTLTDTTTNCPYIWIKRETWKLFVFGAINKLKTADNQSFYCSRWTKRAASPSPCLRRTEERMRKQTRRADFNRLCQLTSSCSSVTDV